VRNRSRHKHRKWRKRQAAELAARAPRPDEFEIPPSAQRLTDAETEEEYTQSKTPDFSEEARPRDAESELVTSLPDVEPIDAELPVEQLEPVASEDDLAVVEAEPVAADGNLDTPTAQSAPIEDESDTAVSYSGLDRDEPPAAGAEQPPAYEEPAASEVQPEELFAANSVSGITAGLQEPAAEELLEKAAREATERDEVQRAGSIYEELLRINPRNVKARNNLALLLDRNGDREGALEALDRCLSDDPDCVQAKINRGAILASLARYREAERDLLAAVRQDSGNAEGHFNLGLLSIRKGLWADAVPYLRRSIELDASRPSAHYYLGEALNHVDDLQGAMQSYQRAAELQPTNPEALYGLGIVLDRLNRPDDAAQMYRRSRELAGR
jgi:tetratricopeptide (TPR) repeat protein